MGVLKTFLLGAPRRPDPGHRDGGRPGPDRRAARLFASCAGRLSATIEHGWLTDLGDGAREARLRRGFEDLIAAILPDARAVGLDGPRILHQRIAAKFAQAQLLQTASFHRDTRRAARARLLADRELARCTAILPH